MKEKYVTITGMNHYYGIRPFSVGKKIKCMKEPSNAFDTEAIKVTMKEIGKVGYIANSPFTGATGTMSAGRIYEQVGKKFFVEIMFITSSKVIGKVVEGFKSDRKEWKVKEDKKKNDKPITESKSNSENI